MQRLKRLLKTAICILTAFSVSMSFSVLSLIYAEPRRPYEPTDPDETTEEMEEPPVETTTEPPVETTTTEPPPIQTDPPVIETDPPATDPEPPTTEETSEDTEAPPPVNNEEIHLNFYQSTLEEGEGIQLIATLVNSTDADPVIAFYSNNTAVVRVDASGYIIATGAGETEVVAYYGNVMATAIITVVAPTIEPEYIILAESSFSLYIGGIAKIEATLLPEEISGSYHFTYESLNTDVAEVDADGVITAIGEGETEIIVSAADLSAKATVKVTKEAVIVKSKIDGFLYNTKGEPMAGSIVYLDGQTATVDKNGHFSFDSVDQKKAILSVSDFPEVKCEYTVLKDATIYLLSQDSSLTMLPTLGELQGRLPISEVSFDSQNIILNEGEVYPLNYTYQPKNAPITEINYVSSNVLVVQVGQIDGVLTAKSAGEAVITLTVNGGQASVDLYVTVNQQASTKYTPLIVVLEGVLFAAAAAVVIIYYRKYQRTLQEEIEDEEDDNDLHDIE